MKKIITIICAVGLILGQALGQQGFTVTKHSMQIEGTSSLHDWVSEAQTVTATGSIQMSDGMLEGISSLKVKVKVEDIESPKGKMMDKKTYNALEYEDHPYIIFELTNLKSLKANGASYDIVAVGNLTIAGTTKSIELAVKAHVNADGTIRFEGEKPLKMTSFNVEPPTALMGTLKTGDEITVRYDVTVATNGQMANK